MLGWAMTFFILSIAAALFGFTGIAAAATTAGKFFFFLFILLFLAALLLGLAQGRRPRV
jgi:uncharacterized membrane protein YtjA (UPF0391 family)